MIRLYLFAMERYVVSARKYRPQDFKSVVGQQHITNTLENAIANNHLAQAMLFCGPRGVGKTTCARILARMINENEQPETEEKQDYAFNIFELDAASNNSVDDIRNLTDQVRFAPQVGKYKVYIIDEVHMLSQAAFNAFLKTLEEPPAHAIFILATTEKHKIIPTILSRCQIFDFKRITVEDIANHLSYVAEQEGVKADPEGLHIIAQKADGALRDSLSIFDRLVSFNGNEISYESVIQNLNILDYDYYFKATNFIMAQDLQKTLLLFNEVLEKGFEGIQFVNGLAIHFRDLLVGYDAETVELLQVGPSVKKRYLEQAKKVQVPFLIYALRILNECDVKYRTSSNQRLLAEVTIMQVVDLLKKKSDPKPASQQAIKREAPKTAIAEPPKQTIDIQHPPKAPAPLAAKPAPETKFTPNQEASTVEEPQESIKTEQPEPRKPKTGGTDWLSKAKNRKGGIRINTESPEEAVHLDEAIEPKEDANPKGPTEVFSEYEFEEAWKAFINSIKSKKSILGILEAHKPTLKNLHELHFELLNKTQESYLHGAQPEMLQFLRERLKNYNIKVVVHISNKEHHRKAYTAEERYKAMLKANPHLETLRKALDLDIE